MFVFVYWVLKGSVQCLAYQNSTWNCQDWHTSLLDGAEPILLVQCIIHLCADG